MNKKTRLDLETEILGYAIGIPMLVGIILKAFFLL